MDNSAFRLEGPYETDELQLKSGDTVIDIGANIGLFSIYAAKQVGASGRVYACEPIAVTRALLEQNAALNRCDNVHVLSHALGASACDVSFAVNDSVLGDSTQDQSAPGRKEVVRQITLDELVRQEGISHVDCIKADIEGMEREMIAGAVETLRRDMPKLAICIYHKPDDPEVIERLIKDAVPTYTIRKTRTKLFAWREHV